MFHLIIHQSDIDKIYLYARDPYKAKYQFLLNKRESVRLKHFNDSKVFLLNTQMIWMIFTKILKDAIQIKNVKY